MTNQERLIEYLLGNKEKGSTGYLKDDISNGKVIMLSGKWGSGKTHFWQNEIANDKLKKELKDKRKVYSYTSLYGKSSIEEIENDIFSQAYSSAIGGENFITKGFATFTKRMKRFGSSKIANGLKEEQKDNIERTALSRLNNGGIICFDDFERKSKDIDLNDIFGFITQLTINFNCKVVIILNDDVFEGEEKNIFSNVKEKSVSKFLKYEPSINELFDSIFDNDERYSILSEHKDCILKTIEETKELNARIYIQILDNLLEWIDKKQEINDNVLRCLILVNINFIKNHYIFYYDNSDSIWLLSKIFKENNTMTVSIANKLNNFIKKDNRDSYTHKSELIDIFKQIKQKNYTKEKNKEEINMINLNSNLIWIFWKFEINLKYRQNISIEQLNKINNFIETGILIDD
ncbi:hypothetical protein [Poseidonibacter sp.]|uniref:hypothetical protein n=1 Tax=Poseidonibacter sp. TaxID=2321188 RepID=UPI003C77E898